MEITGEKTLLSDELINKNLTFLSKSGGGQERSTIIQTLVCALYTTLFQLNIQK